MKIIRNKTIIQEKKKYTVELSDQELGTIMILLSEPKLNIGQYEDIAYDLEDRFDDFRYLSPTKIGSFSRKVENIFK